MSDACARRAVALAICDRFAPRGFPGAAEVNGGDLRRSRPRGCLVRPPAVAIGGRAIMGATRERDGAIAQLVRAADS